MGIEPKKVYAAWLADPYIDPETKKELRDIADNDKEIEERFYKELEFGTGGLRGVIGAGTNRINRYTIGKATQGLAQYLLAQGTPSGKSLAVVIAHDSRHGSAEFALEAALVLAGNGIKAYVFDSLRPTPELSFAVRELGAVSGIVITASHNPPEYNGYKVYGPDGGQLVPDAAERVIAEIRRIASFSSIRRMERSEAERSGQLEWIGEAIDHRYVAAVTAAGFAENGSLAEQLADLKIVYTPLHGAGNRLVRMVLESIGAKQVRIVPEQELPDPDFRTVKSPNPEERDAFAMAIEQARHWGADLIIGTDPDADRMGAAVLSGSDYVLLSGNQSGALMAYYVLGQMKQAGTLPNNGAVIKTIVTSELGAKIAQHYGMTVFNTLTGFKYIGEKMTLFERTGSHTFLFGYEESYGYLAGTYARDKDAVLAAMLISEAAAYYKRQGKTLLDVLHELYERFGYFQEKLETRTLKGVEGMKRIEDTMSSWRNDPPAAVAGQTVKQLLDYELGIDGLPKENVLKFILEDGSWFCLRPSGTEPKLKVYFAVCGRTEQEADERLNELIDAVMSRVDRG